MLRNTLIRLSVLLMLLSPLGCATTSSTTTETESTEETTTEVETTESTETTEVKQLRVGMEVGYAPYNWQEDEATDTNWPVENVEGAYAEGYDVQISKLIADYLGYELVIVKLSWSGLIEALNQGQIDAIIAGMSDTEERRQSINFSDAYFGAEDYALLVNAGSEYENATSIQDFSGATVLGQANTLMDDAIDQIEGVIHAVPVETVPMTLSRLQQGTVDAVIINLENAEAYLATDENFRLVTFEEGYGFELGFTGSCVGLRKSDTELLELINEAIATISEEQRDEIWETALANQPS